jgi:hypothetical protein
MHLKGASEKLTKLVVISTIFFLLLLLALTMSDYGTRPGAKNFEIVMWRAFGCPRVQPGSERQPREGSAFRKGEPTVEERSFRAALRTKTQERHCALCSAPICGILARRTCTSAHEVTYGILQFLRRISVPGTRFCNKCGTRLASTLPTIRHCFTTLQPLPRPPPPISQGGGALKIILIVIAVIIGLGILSARRNPSPSSDRIAKRSRHQDGDHVKVETPFGSVETSKDRKRRLAKDLGSRSLSRSAAPERRRRFGRFRQECTPAASFESTDPVDQISASTNRNFPTPWSPPPTGRCTIVSNDQKNMITVNISRAATSRKSRSRR